MSAWIVAALAAGACGGKPAAARKPAAESAEGQAERAPGAASTEAPPAPTPPDGYIQMKPAGVVPGGERQDGGEQFAVVGLVDEAGTVMIPIFIGGTEGTTIQLRLYDQAPPRPFTHDLLDSMLESLGAKVYKVHVDDLVDGTFIGSVFIHQGKHIWKLDARPSDAIAIAVGHSVPIYVASKVV
jgi:hypothetical protein